MSLSDKVVLVTGESQGIGRATALAFMAAGARVAPAARRAEVLADVAAPHGDRALALGCDVTDEADVDAMFAAMVARFGLLDIVFNNAGATCRDRRPGAGRLAARPVGEPRRRVPDRRGALRVMRAQTPRGGRIINNGSISAQAPRIGSAAYTASKHGVTRLTKTMALDGRPHDIASCQIDIGAGC